MVSFEPKTLGVPVRYSCGENKYVAGYTGLGLRGDATLDNMNLKVVYIKIAFTGMGGEQGAHREHVRIKTEGSGLSPGNTSELVNEYKRENLL